MPASRKSNPEASGCGAADAQPAAPTLSDVRAQALRLLSRREYGREELTRRLARKWGRSGEQRQVVEACVAGLVDEGLLSDHRFVESFIRSRQGRGQGPLRIRAELQQRRVDAGAISALLDDGDETWITVAVAWLRRRAPAQLDRAARGRFHRRLTSRGFSHAQAMAALGRFAEESDDGLSFDP